MKMERMIENTVAAAAEMQARIKDLESQLPKAREKALEEAAGLCESARTKLWTFTECAEKIRDLKSKA